MKTQSTVLLLALALTLSACKRDEPAPVATDDAAAAAEEADLAAGQPATPPVEPPADAIIPVTVAANAFPIGSALGADGQATAPKAGYAIGDTIHASLPGGKYPNGAIARIYWTYAKDGISHKEEEKKVSSGPVSFEFSKADGMKPGKYNVEIDVNDRPVGIVDVEVK